MSLNWKPLLFGTGLAGMDILAFPFVKLVHLGWNPLWMIVPTLIYALDPYILLQSLQFENLSIMNLLWNLLSNIFITVIGVLVFKEKISKFKTIGILLGLISIGIMAYSP
jgi:multidrug transporter EmrE-like cation transporter